MFQENLREMMQTDIDTLYPCQKQPSDMAWQHLAGCNVLHCKVPWRKPLYHSFNRLSKTLSSTADNHAVVRFVVECLSCHIPRHPLNSISKHGYQIRPENATASRPAPNHQQNDAKRYGKAAAIRPGLCALFAHKKNSPPGKQQAVCQAIKLTS